MSKPLLGEWGNWEENALTQAIAGRGKQGLPVRDFVTANPQEHGLEFDQELLANCFEEGLRNSRIYRPDPRGQLEAREAVARYHGEVYPEQVILTPGTSMAYWYAFRLLCAAGGQVLVPSPTYPLFGDLSKLAGVDVRRYHMRPQGFGRWIIDHQEIKFQITPRTRAIVVVSPHNPTGSVATDQELAKLGEVAREFNLPIIFDEVFREFTHCNMDVLRPREFGAPLTITLNGFSKMFSLPGVKAGWMVVEGEPARRAEFLKAAEYLSDCLLPVNEAVQAAMPSILEQGKRETARFRKTYRERMAALVDAWFSEGIQYPPHAGIYLPVPRREPVTEKKIVSLLEREGILVHPGSFYDLPEEYLVMNCAAAPPYPISQIVSHLP